MDGRGRRRLGFLHAKGIYHRDIKPQNLLLFHGRVKLGDLGLAKLVGASTASHTGSGTFGYLPPEAWEEHRLTPTVDLYGLAATYIKLRTGREPFGNNPVEIVERQKRGQPVLDGLEERERSLVLAALHPDPAKRFSEGCQKWVARVGNFEGAVPSPSPTSVESAPAEPLEKAGLQKTATIVVDGVQVKSLEEALQRSAPGDVIRLPAGVYRLSRPLEITKSVTLVGEGMDSTKVVCDGEGYVIKVSGGKFSARGISFAHDGQNWADVMVIDWAYVVIENYRFRGGVWDAENKRDGDGVWMRGATTGAVKGSVFVQNGLHRIDLSDVAEVLLEGNTCEANNSCGIAYFGNAGGTARNNVCRSNRQDQIWIARTASPILVDNEGAVKKEN